MTESDKRGLLCKKNFEQTLTFELELFAKIQLTI